ncbi:2-keto-4-pentenoate hydratase/2-oxohepta-3-ene-1,7-dioic acid hydratase (catechol pathway) [Abditibacterium utsteinense]|uniref:2-keto-4-pentenoate hydratase/2-oxohepta-3-ene-1,7-dioic acid hydratase (Catechol pathway) n=1 Tax=Abditibacterium utsteinense TaxID=1960156 RepID=A0A2S8SRI0_9BACT|nr:fumarylacetoacetate hydrolase family protein [Abditibacterium utsteinense]PQV63414.1 2-keto-4-pentenoate hydratase/2-oxohepta-3-ene-1,7-dioic acid hydratase (catechol pathway) [Abditibacterium utsteinense]
MSTYGQFLWKGAARHARIEMTGGEEVAHFIENLFENPTSTGESARVSELTILPPVAPAKLFAIGLNYAAHAAEHGNEVPKEPLMWFKAPSALIAHGEEIEIAFPGHKTDFEGELALIIGKRGKAIAESQAHEYIFGVTCAQDISDRVIQRGESQWARAKSFDTYAPLGPYIYTDLDLGNLTVQTILNGQTRQSGHTKDMIFSPARIVSFVSQHITLEAGDVILTGTPEGVGALKSGDILETHIGTMKPLINLVKNSA